MKTLTLTLFATLCCLFSFAQSTKSTLQTPTVSLVKNSQVFLNSDRAELASLGTYENIGSATFVSRNSDGARCEKAKKMKTVGIILSAVGGTFLIGGIAMEAIAVNSLSSGNLVGDDMTYVGLVGGGAACIIVGLAGAGAGIPLAIIGAAKSKRYCGAAKESSLNLNTGKNGLGLAYKF